MPRSELQIALKPERKYEYSHLTLPALHTDSPIPYIRLPTHSSNRRVEVGSPYSSTPNNINILLPHATTRRMKEKKSDSSKNIAFYNTFSKKKVLLC